jgi:hypothetical protein
LVKQAAIVSVEGDQDPALANGPLEHGFVRNSGRILHHGCHVVAGRREDTNARQRKILVGEELHAQKRLTT